MELQALKNRFEIIGNDPQLNYALEVAEQVANTDLSVLIFGESGVGKEVFSQVIHNLSSRRHNPFIAVNCGAIPEGTIDSELFGHEKGAFTSATDSRKGYFETVNGGTIFLDEIGEMPLGTQARLLRVLETGEFIKVGSSKVMKTNVRVIAATNKDLLAQTKTGKFREDLYYRLNTVPIKVPALRERKADIPLLFRKFTNDFAAKYRSKLVRLTPEAQELLMEYSWPGNVRELKNIAEQISVLVNETEVDQTIMSKFLPVHQQETGLLLAGNNDALTYQPGSGGQSSSATERELLYKLIFDLKRDINEMKAMLYGMSSGRPMMSNDVIPQERPIPSANMLPPAQRNEEDNFSTPPITSYHHNQDSIILHTDKDSITHHEDVEESLSLEEMEINLIKKALKKHRGKRKDAALELGISDRTLYRKIKEYDLEE
ncbi:MAG: sigma-54 dependent transcriptional regulator [Taibaiella sp.]|nr:sigma-54 dependent transcriptional regulator [Taibaiella sp.]